MGYLLIVLSNPLNLPFGLEKEIVVEWPNKKNLNTAPVQKSFLPNRILAVGESFSRSLNSFFADAEGDALTLSLGQVSGEALPGWLLFDGATLSGQAPPESLGTLLNLRLRASDGREEAFVDFQLSVGEAHASIAKVNFQLPTVAVPSGYLGDFGEAYGSKTRNGQTWTFGWVHPETFAPLSMAEQLRERNYTGLDARLRSLMNMDHPTRLPKGIWEMALPNGRYWVNVVVGDPGVWTDPEIHRINVEDVNILTGFAPSGTAASPGRFFSRMQAITVTDGRLTLDYFNGGINTKLCYLEIHRREDLSNQTGYAPSVLSSLPQDGATNVTPENITISANNLYIPIGTDLQVSTVNPKNIRLYELDAQGNVLAQVSGDVNDTGGGDALNFTPFQTLKPGTTYQFVVTEGVKVNNGASFIPYQATFATSESTQLPEMDLSQVKFLVDRAFCPSHPNSLLGRHTSLVIGPDGKLYASTLEGKIKRWSIAANGTLSNYELLSPPLKGTRNGQTFSEDRVIIGLAFDPASTPQNLIAYVSHSKLTDFTTATGDELAWDGKISRLSGAQLNTVQDLVIHLPRSKKDHLTNSLAFKPGENALYFSQGSNSAAGAYDNAWRMEESLLAAAILKLDLNKLPSQLPIDAKTTNNIAVINQAPLNGPMSDGTYNPYSMNAPLTIFSSGVRNAYDLLWHSNGHLYVPVNGTAGGSNSPASGNYVNLDPSGLGVRRMDGTFYQHGAFPQVPAALGNETQKDWLIIAQAGSYHGHPNPLRGEFAFNHASLTYDGIPGQTTPHVDVAKYPAGTLPDTNFHVPAFDFGFNKSANGIAEYSSPVFGGALEGMLLVAYLSNGDDILALRPAPQTGTIVSYNWGIEGFTGFDDPLDLVAHPQSGVVYVAEYDRGGNGVARLTLLRPDVTSLLAFSAPELIFQSVVGQTSAAQTVEVQNLGSEAISINQIGLRGLQAANYIVQAPSSTVINPGQKISVSIQFNPKTIVGYTEAELFVSTSAMAEAKLPLYGLSVKGLEGSNEPLLQTVLNVLGHKINVGWTTLGNTTSATPQGEEVILPLFQKAGPGDVEVQVLGRYSPTGPVPYGYYTYDANRQRTEFEVNIINGSSPNHQMLFPALLGTGDRFDPGDAIFGWFAHMPHDNRSIYSEDILNTGGVPHRVRVYPAKNRQGQLMPNAYIIGTEEASNGDYQDQIFLLTNVRPPVAPALAFSPASQSISLLPGAQASLNTILSAQSLNSPATITLQASSNGTVPGWLRWNGSLVQNLVFQVEQSAALSFTVNTEGLATGTYQATVTATGPENLSAVYVITLLVSNTQNPLSIQSLLLINADTDQVIGSIQEGQVYQFATLPPQLAVQAVAASSQVNSIEMVLSGAGTHTQLENVAPYALFGDVNGNFSGDGGKMDALGAYTLTVTPYSEAKKGGKKVSEPAVVTFLFTNTPEEEVENCEAFAGPDLVLDCDVPTVQLEGSASEGEIWSWTGPNGFTSNELQPVVSLPGTYVLTVSNLGGSCTDIDAVVVSECVASPNTGVFLVNAQTDADYTEIAPNQVFGLSQLNAEGLTQFSVRAEPTVNGTTKISFNLKGANPHNSSRTEGLAPYALFGDNKGDYVGKLLVAGSYILEIKELNNNNQLLASNTLTFLVENQAARTIPVLPSEEVPDLPVEAFEIFPNPFNRTLHLRFEPTRLAIVHLEIFSMMGQKIALARKSEITDGHWELTLPEATPEGMYLVQIQASDGKVYRQRVRYQR
ncbi:MAG: hypothetical protein OHK0053_18320 [Microscillaceae bacterium]